MREKIKKIFIIFILLAMLLTTIMSSFNAESYTVAAYYGQEYNGCDLIEGSTYHYSKGRNKVNYFYSDGYFRDASTTYNNHLSTMSLTLQIATMENSENPYGMDVLKNLSFNDVEYLTTTSNIKVLIGHKKIFEGKEDETILIPVTIAHIDELLYYQNFYKISASGNASGANAVANDVLALVNKYIADKKVGTNVKFWVTGYSCGGGVGDLLSKTLSDTYTKDKVYAYLFEPIKVAAVSTSGTYANIHCISNYNSGASNIIPTYLGFGYYGVLHYFGIDKDNANFDAEEAKMLKQLEVVNNCQDDYISPKKWTWAQINVGISTLIDYLGSSEGELNVWKFIDTNHKYGTSPHDFYEFAISRMKATLLTCRADYTTNIPEVKKFGINKYTSVGSITLETAVGYLLDIFSTITDEQIDQLSESMPNIPYASNLLTIEGLYSWLTNMSPGVSVYYMTLIDDLWKMFDTSKYEYVKISSILTSDQASKLKATLPIVLYRAAQFTSVDWGEEKQVIGTVGNNLDYIIQAINPSYNLAWLRSYDSYYDNEVLKPLEADASNVTEYIVTSDNESLSELTVSILDSTGSVISSIVGGKLSNDNITELTGKAFVTYTDKNLVICLDNTTNYSLKFASTDTLEKVKVVSRLYNQISSSDTKEIYLYTGQIGYISATSGMMSVKKDIVVTTTDCSAVASKDKTEVAVTTTLKDYCSIKWSIDGSVDKDKTSSSFTISVSYDTPNYTVKAEKITHDYQYKDITWTDYTAKANYVCSHDSKHTQSYDCTVTHKTTTTASCILKGVETYTATYDDHTATKKQDLGYADHNYGSWIDEVKATCEQDGTLGHYKCSVCRKYFDDKKDELKSLVILKLNHDYEYSSIVWTSFTAKAVYVCSHDSSHTKSYTCNITYKTTREPSCALNGIRTYTASYDGHTDTKDEDLGYISHTYGAWIDEVKATCEQDGTLGHYHCSVCDKNFDASKTVLSSLVINKLNHNYVFDSFVWNDYTATAKCICANDSSHIIYPAANVTNAVTTDPTCISKGVRTYTATYDKYSDTATEDVDMIDHTFGSWNNKIDATCTLDGTKGYYYCSACKKNYDINEVEITDLTIPALQHDYQYDSFVWDGYTAKAKYICSHDSKHVQTYDASVTNAVTTNPTCISKGVRTYTATYDKYSDTATEDVDMIDHTLGSWNNEVKATCTLDGTKGYYYCSACKKNYDINETEITDLTNPALQHDYQFVDITWTDYTAKANYVCSHDTKHTQSYDCNVTNAETTKPTCTDTGVRTYTATYDKYSDTKTQVLSALQHDYQYTKMEWTNYTAKAVYTCSHDNTHVQKYNATVTNAVTKNASCVQKGVRTYTATYDKYSDTKTQDIAMLAHDLAHTNRKEATRATDGNIEYWYCSSCKNYYSNANASKKISKEETIIHKESIVVSSISMKNNPTKEEYIQDEVLDVTGGEVTLKLSNGLEENVTLTNDMVTNFDSSEASDNKEVIVTYGGKYTSFNIKIGPKYKLGDVNNDDIISDADAIHLLMHTFFPEEYQVNQPCDFNNDGEINDADAIHLLMYTFFPEEYPLTK